MKKYLLPKEGIFYKANLHCHSTFSDGQWTPEEIKERYKAKGYSIIAYTDHDIMVPHSELADEDFLPLTGIEYGFTNGLPGIHRKNCDICMIALSPDNLIQPCWHREKYFVPELTGRYRHLVKFDEDKPDFERVYSPECINALISEGTGNGFFVTYNHPTWSMERYNDYMSYNGMHAMEICNYGCIAGGHDEYNAKEYDDMLRGGKKLFCISTDDNHNKRDDSFGGFTMIKAEKLEYTVITDALIKGHFYASQGPEIYELWYENGYIGISCSECREIVLTTDSRRKDIVKAEDMKYINSAVFKVNEDDIYVRITITDDFGRHANTNAYFISDLNKNQ